MAPTLPAEAEQETGVPGVQRGVRPPEASSGAHPFRRSRARDVCRRVPGAQVLVRPDHAGCLFSTGKIHAVRPSPHVLIRKSNLNIVAMSRP